MFKKIICIYNYIILVLVLFIAYVASYPSFRDSSTDNDENDTELELRAILNQLDEEQMTRSLTSGWKFLFRIFQ